MGEVIVFVILGLIAALLVGFGAWLLDGWIEPGSIWVIGLLGIAAIVFVGAGFIALVLLGAIIAAFAAALSGN